MDRLDSVVSLFLFAFQVAHGFVGPLADSVYDIHRRVKWEVEGSKRRLDLVCKLREALCGPNPESGNARAAHKLRLEIWGL